MLERKYLSSLLSGIVLVAIVIWYSWFDQPEPTATANPLAPDYYLINANTVQYTKQGNLDYRLLADQVTHQPKGDTALLTRPKLTGFIPDKPPWTLSADQGEYFSDGDKLKLWQHVVAKRFDQSMTDPIILTTTELTGYLDSKVAETDQPVTIRNQQAELQGVGARLYADQDKFKLLSQVAGSYAVKKAD
jgi:lipopolysaccharide export system protein LptC